MAKPTTKSQNEVPYLPVYLKGNFSKGDKARWERDQKRFGWTCELPDSARERRLGSLVIGSEGKKHKEYWVEAVVEGRLVRLSHHSQFEHALTLARALATTRFSTPMVVCLRREDDKALPQLSEAHGVLSRALPSCVFREVHREQELNGVLEDAQDLFALDRSIPWRPSELVCFYCLDKNVSDGTWQKTIDNTVVKYVQRPQTGLLSLFLYTNEPNQEIEDFVVKVHSDNVSYRSVEQLLEFQKDDPHHLDFCWQALFSQDWTHAKRKNRFEVLDNLGMFLSEGIYALSRHNCDIRLLQKLLRDASTSVDVPTEVERRMKDLEKDLHRLFGKSGTASRRTHPRLFYAIRGREAVFAHRDTAGAKVSVGWAAEYSWPRADRDPAKPFTNEDWDHLVSKMDTEFVTLAEQTRFNLQHGLQATGRWLDSLIDYLVRIRHIVIT